MAHFGPLSVEALSESHLLLFKRELNFCKAPLCASEHYVEKTLFLIDPR